MTEPTRYHQRIQRATERLAQLQARNLLATQRQASKARATQRREEAKRRVRIAELVILAGAETLDDGELVGALLLHMDSSNDDHDPRDDARLRGELRLAMVEGASPTASISRYREKPDTWHTLESDKESLSSSGAGGSL